MPSGPTIIGVKQVFSQPLVDDPASQHGNCRIYRRPDGAMSLACLGNEFKMATVGWHGGLFVGEEDVTKEHPVFQRILDEDSYGLMLDVYQPWSCDGRLLLLSNWADHVYFYNVHAKAARPLDLPAAGVVALGAPSIPRYLVADAKHSYLLDLEGDITVLALPCKGICYFRWTSSSFLLAVGKHAETRESTLWIIDGQSGETVGAHILDPLKLHSKTYPLGDIGQMQISYDRDTGILYFRPLFPGAQSWALELGE